MNNNDYTNDAAHFASWGVGSNNNLGLQLGISGTGILGGMQSSMPPLSGNGLGKAPIPPLPTDEQLLNAITTSYDAVNRAAFRTPQYTPDELLRAEGYDGVDKLQTMACYNRCIRFLKYVIMYKPWQTLARVNGLVVKPDHPRYDAAIKAADLCRYVLNNIYDPDTGARQDLREVVWYMLDACHIGFSAQELWWRLYDSGPYKGMRGLRRVIPRRPKQVTFNIDPLTTMVDSINNYTPLGGWQSYLPLRKFLLYTYQGQNGLPYGSGLWRITYKHITSINELIKILIVALSKHGGGMLKAVVHNPDPAHVKNVEAMLAKVANGAPLIVPAGMEVELLNLPNGVLEPILSALEYHEEQIVKAILGQSLTTGQGSGSSSYALGGVHQDTQEYFVAHARLDVEKSIQQQVYAEIIRINLGEDYMDVIPAHSQGEYDINERQKVADFIATMRTSGIVAANEPQLRDMTGFAPASETIPPWPEMKQLSTVAE